MSVREALQVLSRRRWVFLAVVALTTLTGVIVGLARDSEYESEAVIALTPVLSENLTAIPNQDAVDSLIATLARTVTSAPVEEDARRRAGRPLGGPLDAFSNAGENTITVTARSGDPEIAQEDAQALLDAFVASLAENQFFSATVISAPSLPDAAVPPRPPLIIATALVVGLALGLLLALAVDVLRRHGTRVEEIAAVTDAPVLGHLPRRRGLDGRVLRPDEDGPAARELQEAFGVVRTGLELALGADADVLMVTSASRGQGGSTLVANLAVAFARTRREVIVVDADLRVPTQHELFGVGNEDGVSTWGQPGRPRQSVETDIDGVRLLPAGPPVADAADRLQTWLPTILASLRHERRGRGGRATGGEAVRREPGAERIILLDAPPLIPVADARIMALHADGVLLVTDSEEPAVLARAVELLRLVDAPLLGLVVNRAREPGQIPYGDG